MAEVVWLRAAVADLEEIAKTISKDSPRYAANVVQRIIDATQLLSLFSRGGPRVPEWDDDDYRQRISYPYRVIYRLMGDRAEILAVIHGMRQLPDVRSRQ